MLRNATTDLCSFNHLFLWCHSQCVINTSDVFKLMLYYMYYSWTVYVCYCWIRMDPIHLLSAKEKQGKIRNKLMQKILTSLEIDCFIDIRSIFRSHGLSFPIELRCFVFVSRWISMSQLIRLRLTWNMMKVVKKYRTFIFTQNEQSLSIAESIVCISVSRFLYIIQHFSLWD